MTAWQDLLETAGDVVRTTLAGLPAPVREHVAEIAILLEKSPSQADLREGIAPDTLGHFDEDATGTRRIRLWLENIADYCDYDRDAFIEEVEITLLHEIGHAVGWDEEDLDERGLA